MHRCWSALWCTRLGACLCTTKKGQGACSLAVLRTLVSPGLGAAQVKLIEPESRQCDRARDGFVAMVVVGNGATAQTERDGGVFKRIVLTQAPGVKGVGAHRCPRLFLR